MYDNKTKRLSPIFISKEIVVHRDYAVIPIHYLLLKQKRKKKFFNFAVKYIFAKT